MHNLIEPKDKGYAAGRKMLESPTRSDGSNKSPYAKVFPKYVKANMGEVLVNNP